MFKFLKNKTNKKDQNSNLILKTASLLIHAAKIDENYTNAEKSIIRETLLSLDPENNDIEKLLKMKKSL